MAKAHTGMFEFRRGARVGFTLIELLVVIAIIAILVSVSVLVAGKVTEGGRADQTRSILKVMDQVLTQYAADKEGGKFPSVYTYVTGPGQNYEFPIVDGRRDSASVNIDALPEPTVQLFLLASGESASLLSMVNGIDGTYKDRNGARGRLVSSEEVRSFLNNASGDLVKTANGSSDAKAPMVRDPWGNAIRYVHPKFAGGHGDFYAQSGGTWGSKTRQNLTVNVRQGSGPSMFSFRRSYRPFNPITATGTPVGDADEGLTAGSRPYFYSAGPDGDPGTRDDNVYLDTPAFPSETKSAN